MAVFFSFNAYKESEYVYVWKNLHTNRDVVLYDCCGFVSEAQADSIKFFSASGKDVGKKED